MLLEDIKKLDDRQFFVLGADAMKTMLSKNVFIQGIHGIGIETAKNLLLTGIGSLTIQDNTMATFPDLGVNFYLREKHVSSKLSRANACLPSLQQLNPRVTVTNYTGVINEDFLKNYQFVIFTEEYNREFLIKMNNFCRANDIGFIWTGNLGLFGYTFIDFGAKEFSIKDKNGEEPKKAPLQRITLEGDKMWLFPIVGSDEHNQSTVNTIEFSDVEGCEGINGQSFKIKKIVKDDGTMTRNMMVDLTDYLKDNKMFSNYKTGGMVTEIKNSKQRTFRSLEEALANPLSQNGDSMYFNDYLGVDKDWSKLYKPAELWILQNSMLDYFKEHKQLPQILNEADCENFKKIAAKRHSKDKDKNIKVESLDKEQVKNISMFARTCVTSTAAFFGAINANEMIKVTGKYTPLDQWMLYSTFDKMMPNPDAKVTRNFKNLERHRDQVALWGRETQKKINNSKLFMIGAGAQGCEYLKILALMGFGSGDNGLLTVTDNDEIAVSNLSRQFQFHKEHIGHSKAKVAAEAAIEINPKLKVEAKIALVYPGTEPQFNDEFWEKQDLIVIAVDNVKARRYIDSRCIRHKTPLFEAGTQGTKFSSVFVLPNQTASYRDHNKVPVNHEVASCTQKEHPYLIQHCMDFSKQVLYGEIFPEGVKDFKEYSENPKMWITNMRNSNDKDEVKYDRQRHMERVTELIKNCCHDEDNSKRNICHYVRFLRQVYHEHYEHKPKSLIEQFPEDHVDATGVPFWSGGRRFPNVINFDPTDIDAMSFMLGGLRILKGVRNDKNEYNLMDFQTQGCNTCKPTCNPDKFDCSPLCETFGLEDEELKKRLDSGYAKLEDQEFTDLEKDISLIEWEKDDELNGQIDFIHGGSNLRAKVYRIQTVDRPDTKRHAGRIIPAVITSTSLITSFVTNNMYKLFLDKPIEAFCGINGNLAYNDFLTSTLNVPKVSKPFYDEILGENIVPYPENFNTWDVITIEGPKTLKEVIAYVAKEHAIEVDHIEQESEDKIYYVDFQNNTHENLELKVEEVFAKFNGPEQLYAGKKYIWLYISGISDNGDGDSVYCPPVKYVLNK